MFVSFLQRLGFKSVQRSVEPLQSRADQNTRIEKSGGFSGNVSATGLSASRASMNSMGSGGKPGKNKGKQETRSKKIESIQTTQKGQDRPAAVTSGLSPKIHPQAEVQRRQTVKAPAKKPATPSKASIHARAVAKPQSGSALEKPKAASESSSKAPLKASSKVSLAETKKTASRVVLQPAERVAQPVKTTQAPVPVKPVIETKPAQASAGIKPVPPAMAPASKPAPHSLERSTSMTSPPALKPGRRSSARAPSQLPPPAPMVPTHAPDAAKASYSTMTERVIAPPPHVAAKKDPKLANNWKTTPVEELTDEEVKAMPDSEYMNEKQMAFFRHKLSVLKQEIHNSAGETTEHLREDTVVVPDPADRATIEEEHALELRTRDRERKLLKKIEQSIASIDSGDYGFCDETGEPIGVGRLIARPTANLSLEAQQRRELKQKMFGD
jgi:DnaK suppressor protein